MVAGATGYTGAETLRWCLGHPRMEVVAVTSRQAAGKVVADVWPQLVGCRIPVLADAPDADVLFLCLPHGEAARREHRHPLVVDLSGDHRLPEPAHSAAYGFPRATPPWIYGLPELGAERLRGATRIANPGCFATALSLALLPMRGRLPARVSAVGLTGSTGSGATPGEGTHHPMRAENVRPYKVLGHQHVPEVVAAVGGGFALDFVPLSVPVRRGILVTASVPGATLAAYQAFYAGNPLVHIGARPPELLHVLGTARAHLSVTEGEVSTVFCAIDNLCRGAGSQAVANVNLAMGWPMDLGLTHVGPLP